MATPRMPTESSAPTTRCGRPATDPRGAGKADHDSLERDQPDHGDRASRSRRAGRSGPRRAPTMPSSAVAVAAGVIAATRRGCESREREQRGDADEAGQREVLGFGERCVERSEHQGCGQGLRGRGSEAMQQPGTVAWRPRRRAGTLRRQPRPASTSSCAAYSSMARRRPDASRTMPSSMIVSSRSVSGLSNGSCRSRRPPRWRRRGREHVRRRQQRQSDHLAVAAMRPRSVLPTAAAEPTTASTETGFHQARDGHLATGAIDRRAHVHRGESEDEAHQREDPMTTRASLESGSGARMISNGTDRQAETVVPDDGANLERVVAASSRCSCTIGEVRRAPDGGTAAALEACLHALHVRRPTGRRRHQVKIDQEARLHVHCRSRPAER